MDIGKLNRRIEVLEFVKDRDEYGGEVGEWIIVGRVWASIEPIKGTEKYFNQQIIAETGTKITMRFYAGLTVTHRIRYGDVVYEIISVIDENTAHRMTTAMAKEIDNGLQCETT